MMLGSSTDRYELVNPTLASSRYCGMASVIPGTSTPASRMLKMAPRPGNRNLARVYPVSPDSAADSSPPTPAYTAVLSIHRQYRPDWYEVRSARLVNSPPLG